jgi:hypothetical protein
MPKIYHKVSGSWQNIARVYHKTSGAWENIQAIWHKAGGVWEKVFSGAVTPTIQTKPTISGSTSNSAELLILSATSYYWYDADTVLYNWQRSIDGLSYYDITSYQNTSNPAINLSLNYTYTVPQSSLAPASRNYFKFASRGINTSFSTQNTELSSNGVYFEMPRDILNFSGSTNSNIINLTWTPPQYSNRQEIQYKQSSSSIWIVLGGFPNSSTSYSVTAAAGTSYDFRIRGWTGNQGSNVTTFTGYYGNWSNTFTITTASAPPSVPTIYYGTTPDYTNLFFGADFATSYYLNVYDQTTNSNAYGFPITVSSGSYTTYNLIRGHNYTASVYGINSSGNGSTASKTFTVPNYIDIVDSSGNKHFAKISGTTAKLGWRSGTYYGAQASRTVQPNFDSTHPAGLTHSNTWKQTINGLLPSNATSTASSYTIPDTTSNTGEAIYFSSVLSSGADYIAVSTPYNIIMPYLSDFIITNNDNGSFTANPSSYLSGSELKTGWLLRYGTTYPLTPNNSTLLLPSSFTITEFTSIRDLLYVEVTPYFTDTNNANIYGESQLKAIYVTNNPPYTPMVSADNGLPVGGTFYWYSSNATDYIWTVYNPNGTINGTFSVSPGTGTRNFWSPAVQGTWAGAGNYTLYVYAHNAAGYSSVASITLYMS